MLNYEPKVVAEREGVTALLLRQYDGWQVALTKDERVNPFYLDPDGSWPLPLVRDAVQEARKKLRIFLQYGRVQ
jgi:hypothetical protein